MNTLSITASAEKRLKSGHLWLYSNEVDNKKTPLKNIAAGEQVALVSPQGKTLAYALVNPNSLICARIVARKKAFDRKQLKQRLASSLALRQQYYSEPFYRWVYGEGDYLPGLVVDRYGDYAVVQINSLGMASFEQAIAECLMELAELKGVLFRNDGNSRKQEGFGESEHSVYGEVPEHIEIIENNTRFIVPVFAGQKTGWFYDHRENRRYLNQLVGDKSVLDVFAYLGGWGISALAHGAKSLTAVDISGFALDGLEQNAKLNGFSEKCECLEGNALDALQALVQEGKKFDVVVLDPPAFIKKKKDYHKGLSAYKKANEMALRLLNPEGLLVSASCSMHLPEADLQQVVQKAARHIDRELSLIHRGGHAFDHPIHPAIKETDYLKAQFYALR
jgi:23S rRNA (cytosine1962-C5)-methyltransferase